MKRLTRLSLGINRFHCYRVMFYLAQFNPTEGGLVVLQDSVNIAQKTADAWNKLWLTTISPDSSLWNGITQVGLIIAAVSILYLAMSEGANVLDRRDWSALVKMLVPPILIAFFLGGGGGILANTVLIVRGIAHQEVNNVLDLQLAELTFEQSLRVLSVSSAARQEVETLYQECNPLVGRELEACYEEKLPVVDRIVADARGLARGEDLSVLEQWSNDFKAFVQLEATSLREPGFQFRDISPGGIVDGFVEMITRPILIPFLRLVLFSMQWAFVNVLEAALLLTALWSPIAFGASLVSINGRPAIAWAIGFLSLFGVQLAYNILVGLMATIIVEGGALFMSDIAFNFFIALFAPVLAMTIAGGGGIAVYRAIDRNVRPLVDTLSGGVVQLGQAAARVL